MFVGKLRTVRFVYTDLSLESELDRIPTARTLGENDGGVYRGGGGLRGWDRYVTENPGRERACNGVKKITFSIRV